MNQYQFTADVLRPYVSAKVALVSLCVGFAMSVLGVTSHWTYFILAFIGLVYSGSLGVLWVWNKRIQADGSAPIAVYSTMRRLTLVSLFYTFIWAIFALDSVLLSVVVTAGAAYAGVGLLRRLAFRGFPDTDPVVIEPDPRSETLYAWRESEYIQTLEAYSLEQARSS